MSATCIWSKPLTERQETALDDIAQQQQAGDTSRIDTSDIPPLTDEQLGEFRRVPQPLVVVRLDADVHDWLQQFGSGYSERINNALRAAMAQER